MTKDDLRQHQRYAEYLAAAEDMLTETDADYAPWTVVEAHDRRFATLKIFATVIDALERGVAASGAEGRLPADATFPADPGDQCLQDERARPGGPVSSLTPKESFARLKKAQAKLRELQHQIYLLLFGAKKLPELARGLGQSLGEFKKAGMSSSASFAVPRPKSMLSPPLTSRPIRSLLTSSLISPPESRSGSAALAISLNTSRVRIVACFGAGLAVGPFSSASCLRVVSFAA